MTVVGNSPFGGRGSVVPPPSLPPSLCWLTWLPGHCAHGLSVAISSKLHEAHYSHIPPGGDGAKQHLHKGVGALYGWLVEDRNLSLNSPPPPPTVCALSISSLPLLLIFLLCAEKGWIRMTFPLPGSTVSCERGLTSSESRPGCSSLRGWALNCVSSPQDADSSSTNHERELNIMQNRWNRTCTHMHTYVCTLTCENPLYTHTATHKHILKAQIS